MIHNLTEIEFKFINERVNKIHELQNAIGTIQAIVNNSIQLICDQNELEGTWELNLESKSLIKKDEQTSTE